MWQTKTITSPLLQSLRRPNLTGWWLTLWGSYRCNHLSFWPSGLAWQRNKTKNISLILQYVRPPKLGKVVTYQEKLPLIKLLDSSITWFCVVTWHIKYFSSPPTNMARWWLTYKFIEPFKQVFRRGLVTN